MNESNQFHNEKAKTDYLLTNKKQLQQPNSMIECKNFQAELIPIGFGWKCYRKLNSLFKHQLWHSLVGVG